MHVPKCGGTWIKTALSVSGIRCEPARGGGSHGLDYDHPGARRFCFVRQPRTWLESVWRGLQSSWPQPRRIEALHRERTWSPIRMLTYLAGERDFPVFIERLTSTQPGFVTRMYEAYVGFLGLPRVDYVGRQESLQSDLQTILRWLGWSGTLADVPHVNTGLQLDCAWSDQMFADVISTEFATYQRWYGHSQRSPFAITTE